MYFFSYFFRNLKIQFRRIIPKSEEPFSKEITKSTYWQNPKTAAVYDNNTATESYDKELNRIFCDYVEEIIKPTDQILDIGAGTGVVSLELSDRLFSVTATDISQSMLNHLRKKKSSINTVVGDIFEIHLDQKFDCIVSRWFIPHFRNWDELIGHVTKHFLKQNGYIIFDMPNKNHVEMASEMPYNISPELFGYDHSLLANDDYYYAAATNDEINDVCKHYDLEFVKRIPHGLFKTNLLLANNVGPEKYKEFQYLLSQIGKNKLGRRFLGILERGITPHANKSLVHGSIVVLRKK